MNKFKSFLMLLFISMSIVFTGCQSNNSDLPSDKQSGVVTNEVSFILSNDDLLISSSSQSENLVLSAYDADDTSNVNMTLLVKYPSHTVSSGIDVGYLPSEINIVDGRVQFAYSGPQDIDKTLADLNASGYVDTVTFSLYDQNSSASINMNVTFTSVAEDEKDYSQYTLTVLPELLTISEASESRVVDLYLENDNSQPAANEIISLDYFDGSKGTVNSFSATTDGNGHVSFSYTAPSTITDGPLVTMTFRGESTDLNTVTTAVVVDKSNTLTEPDYSNYTLSAVPATITITEALQSSVVDLYLEDDNSRPVDGETILLDYFDGSKGTVNTFSATTDVNGHVAFEYTAPATVSDGSLVYMTFRGANSTLNTVRTSVVVNTNAVAKDYTGYKISLVDPNRVIEESLQEEFFDIYLKDKSGKAAEGDTIVLDFFDGNSGTVNAFTGVTDANGHVRFTYTAPVDLSTVNVYSMTFRIEGTTSYLYSVSSTLSVSSAATDVPSITLDNNSITVSQNGENVQVKVLAFNSDGEKFSSGSIVVRYPTDIIDGTVSGGGFTANEVPISNGEAIFTFVGPDPLVSITPLNFTFVYKEDTSINTVLSVTYLPEIPKLVFDDASVLVTVNGQIVNIGISVLDKDNSPYPDGNIKIRYPDEVLTGKDVGSFAESTVEVVDGRATFVYTAPSPLSGADSIIFTFYHDAQPLLSEKELTVTITPDAGQVVLTNYTLNSVYETTMDLEVTKQMTFYVADDNGINIPDSNITSMRVTILNPTLGILEDTNGSTGTSLISYNLNNVQMNLRSYTISGVIPIEVYAEFKDANNNDANLTSVYNVVVLSGPPSAMSLSYASTEHDAEQTARAKFVENWILTVTDKYNNLVNTNPAISMGMLAGYTQSSAATANVASYLYYNSASGGTINGTNNTFTAPSTVFGNVDQVNDILVLFGDGYTYNASGKWDFNFNSTTVLDLVDDYNGTDTSSLGFAVGHNYRQDVCGDGVEWVGNVYPADDNYLLGDSGTMALKVEYDYYMTGKDVMLWTNLVGEHNNTTVRIGESKKITLRALGIEGESYSFAKGFQGLIRLNISISETIEYYKNANFWYNVEVTGDDTNWTVTGDSMIDGNITSSFCYENSGVGYVDVTINSPAGEAGTVQLTNVLPINEF